MKRYLNLYFPAAFVRGAPNVRHLCRKNTCRSTTTPRGLIGFPSSLPVNTVACRLCTVFGVPLIVTPALTSKVTSLVSANDESAEWLRYAIRTTRDGPAGATYVKRPSDPVTTFPAEATAAPGIAVRVWISRIAFAIGVPSGPTSFPLIGTRFPNFALIVDERLFASAVSTTLSAAGDPLGEPRSATAFVAAGTEPPE